MTVSQGVCLFFACLLYAAAAVFVNDYFKLKQDERAPQRDLILVCASLVGLANLSVWGAFA